MTGSLAGGTDLTVLGTGFGADASVLEIEVAGVACAVTQINTDGVHCRLGARPAADPVPTRPMPTAALGNDLGSFVGERGVRWQWAGGGGQSMLLTSFAIPSDCALGCGSGWRELGSGGAQVVEVRRAKRACQPRLTLLGACALAPPLLALPISDCSRTVMAGLVRGPSHRLICLHGARRRGEQSHVERQRHALADRDTRVGVGHETTAAPPAAVSPVQLHRECGGADLGCGRVWRLMHVSRWPGLRGGRQQRQLRQPRVRGRHCRHV